MARRGIPRRDPTTVLHEFEGRDVLGSRIAITKAGDGLSQALHVEPREFHVGDKVHVVLECEVGPIKFEPIDKTDALRRVHTFITGTATVVDAKLVHDALEQQRLAIEKAKGIERLPLDGEEGDDL